MSNLEEQFVELRNTYLENNRVSLIVESTISNILHGKTIKTDDCLQHQEAKILLDSKIEDYLNIASYAEHITQKYMSLPIEIQQNSVFEEKFSKLLHNTHCALTTEMNNNLNALNEVYTLVRQQK